MIKLENMSYSISGKELISNINIEIQEGDFVALIGENGAGKSTLTKLIAGLKKPTEGTVFLDGIDTKKLRSYDLAKKIGYLFQNPDKQICQQTIREELLFGLEILDIDVEEKNSRVNEVLKTFNFPPDASPFSLSRGGRQMLTFASVLIMQPQILILDEPTTGLDYRECIQMMDLVKDLNNNGTTVLMVSHDMEVVCDFSKTTLVLSAGHLLNAGTTNDIMRDENLLSQASVMPSQMITLANFLGEGFNHCKTVDDMAQAIESRCK